MVKAMSRGSVTTRSDLALSKVNEEAAVRASQLAAMMAGSPMATEPAVDPPADELFDENAP